VKKPQNQSPSRPTTYFKAQDDKEAEDDKVADDYIPAEVEYYNKAIETTPFTYPNLIERQKAQPTSGNYITVIRGSDLQINQIFYFSQEDSKQMAWWVTEYYYINGKLVAIDHLEWHGSGYQSRDRYDVRSQKRGKWPYSYAKSPFDKRGYLND
jgi:hypothetical protein